MNNWTELHDAGNEHWQSLLKEAENRRLAKQVATQSNLLHWLRNRLKHETKQTRSGELRPLKAKE